MRFDTDAPAKQDVFPALEKGTRAAFAAVVPQLPEGFLENSTPTPLRSAPWRPPSTGWYTTQSSWNSTSRATAPKPHTSENTASAPIRQGTPMRPDPRMPDYGFGRDRRLQAISEACFSLAPTQTDQIADSASVVLPDGVHNNTDTFGEIYFGIDNPKHAKQKDVKLMTKDPALRTRKRNF